MKTLVTILSLSILLCACSESTSDANLSPSQVPAAPGGVAVSAKAPAAKKQWFVTCVDNKGVKVPGYDLRVRFDFADGNSVIQWIGASEGYGIADLSYLHRKLQIYANDGTTVLKVGLLPDRKISNAVLFEVAAQDVPTGKTTITVPRS